MSNSNNDQDLSLIFFLVMIGVIYKGRFIILNFIGGLMKSILVFGIFIAILVALFFIVRKLVQLFSDRINNIGTQKTNTIDDLIEFNDKRFNLLRDIIYDTGSSQDKLKKEFVLLKEEFEALKSKFEPKKDTTLSETNQKIEDAILAYSGDDHAT